MPTTTLVGPPFPVPEANGMTNSQVKTAAGGAVAFIGGLTTAVTPHLGLIPDRYKPTVMLILGVLSAVGVGLAMLNQSLNTNFASVPVETAKAKGIDPSKHGGKV
jgi:hypothetical protein